MSGLGRSEDVMGPFVFNLVTETTVRQRLNTACPFHLIPEHGNFIA